MWDMTDDPFENDLTRLFLKPTGEADASRLKLIVLERLEQEDRRRRLVLGVAAGAGAALLAVAVSASGLGVSAVPTTGEISSALPPFPVFSDAARILWLTAGAVLAASLFLTGRAVRDV